MNLFCFTLDGSSESVYEPAYSQTIKEIQCSPARLRGRAEWGGSNPSISQERQQIQFRRDSRRSCAPGSSSGKEALEQDSYHGCWEARAETEDSLRPKRTQCRELNEASCPSRAASREDEEEETSSDPAPPARRTPAETSEPARRPGRRSRLQSLVPARRGHQRGTARSAPQGNDDLADGTGDDNPVLTCIGLGRRAEKKRSPPSPQRRHKQPDGELEEDQEEALWNPRPGTPSWSPLERPQAWRPLNHTCQQPGGGPWAGGGALSLPRNADWDRFESLIQELDVRQSPPQMIRSITDLQLAHNSLARFGRCEAFREPSPGLRRPDAARRLPTQEEDETVTSRLQRTETEESEGRQAESSLQETLTLLNRAEEEQIEAVGGGPFTNGRRRSSNSLESLSSLHSGQSSSSGVTSGSDCSSNRDSLRLEEDPFSRPSSGRARVHTDFVPSPYDTESLELKVGDVIDVLARPAMGIWRGKLNGKTGSFKFIYVDVLSEEEDPQTPPVRQRSAVRELLRRLSLERYSSSLQLSGYQTVGDLTRLRERHLMKMKVTDPEHRQRLLAAVHSLQLLHPDSEQQSDWDPGDDLKVTMKNGPRDSGCHMSSSDSPDNMAEEAELGFPSDLHQSADGTE